MRINMPWWQSFILSVVFFFIGGYFDASKEDTVHTFLFFSFILLGCIFLVYTFVRLFKRVKDR